MATRKQVMDIANLEEGTREQGNNKVKYNGYNGLAWCAYFVSWVMKQAAMSESAAPQSPSCITMMSKYKSLGRFKSRGSYTPQNGDVIFFHFSSGHAGANHVGLVRSCDGSKVYTIEGNSGNAVSPRSYSVSNGSILGYGIPAYNGSAYSDTSDTSSVSETSQEPPHIPQVTKEYTAYDPDDSAKPVDEYSVVWESFDTKRAIDITDRVGSLKMKDDSDSICVQLDFSVIQSVDELFLEPLKLKLGDYISLNNKSTGKVLFLGQIQSSTGSYSTSQAYVCYDSGRILNSNEIIVQFNNCTTEEAVKTIAKRLGIENVSCPKLVSSVYGIYKENAASIISSILATVTSENGVNYFPRMLGNTLTIRSYADSPIVAYSRQGSNLSSFDITAEISAPSISRDINDMKNTVVIYSEADNSVSVQASLEDTDSVKRYGRRTKVESFSESDKVTAKEKAQNLLGTLNKVNESFSAVAYGSDAVVAGTRLTIDLDEDAKGDYWVTAVEHDYIGQHTMNLTLKAVI